MESEFMAQLIDLGITGLFMGFLIFQNREKATRLDDMQSKYEALLERVLKAVE
jgi:hypothetical protein|tara:strand:- start:1066 stop:1224 length:159 start_codon:yes stop_codon:yes gene_type:complete